MNNFHSIQNHKAKTKAVMPDLNTQFPVKFEDGTIIYQQPSLMKKSASGLPILNTLKYMEENHPERAAEIRKYQEQREKQFKSWDTAPNTHYPFV